MIKPDPMLFCLNSLGCWSPKNLLKKSSPKKSGTSRPRKKSARGLRTSLVVLMLTTVGVSSLTSPVKEGNSATACAAPAGAWKEERIAREQTRDTTSMILPMNFIFYSPFYRNFVRCGEENKNGGGRSISVEVRIPPLAPLATVILSPGDLFDELDAATELLLLQAGGMKGSSQT